MLTKFAAALLATSLIAGPALAAQSSGTPASNATAPAVQTQTPPKTVKQTAHHRNHVRKHVARTKGHAMHHARHAKPTTTDQAGMSKGAKRS